MFTTKTEIWTALFHDKFTLYHIQLTIYIKKINFLQTAFVWSFLLWNTKEDCYISKYTVSFLLCLKRIKSQIFKCSNCKKRFIQCICYFTICFDKCFYPMWQLENKVLLKVIVIPRIFLTAMLLLSLKQVIWKNFPFHFLSPE